MCVPPGVRPVLRILLPAERYQGETGAGSGLIARPGG